VIFFPKTPLPLIFFHLFQMKTTTKFAFLLFVAVIVVVVATNGKNHRGNNNDDDDDDDDNRPRRREGLSKLSAIAALDCMARLECRAKFAVHTGTIDTVELARDIDAMLRSHGLTDETANFVLAMRHNKEDGGRAEETAVSPKEFAEFMVSLVIAMHAVCVDPIALVEARASTYNVSVAVVGMVVAVATFVALFVASVQRSLLSVTPRNE